MPASIILVRYDRLLSRISQVVRGWSMARRIGASLYVMWPHSLEIDGPYEPELVFDTQAWRDLPAIDRVHFLGCAHLPALKSTLNDILDEDGYVDPVKSEKTETYYTNTFSKMRFRGVRRKELLDEFKALFSAIPLSQSVKAEFDGLMERRGGDYSVVHIRRRDLLDHIAKHYPATEAEWNDAKGFKNYVGYFLMRGSATNFYRRKIDRLTAQGRRVIISTDDPGVGSAFPGVELGFGEIDTTLLPIQRAMVDFLLMANARQIVGSSGGSFCLMAVEYGSPQLDDILLRASADDFIAEIEGELVTANLAPDIRALVNAHIRSEHERLRELWRIPVG